MIDDGTILTITSIFFGTVGVLHFVLTRPLEKYAVENGFLNAFVAVRMSGGLLIVGAIALQLEEYRQYGLYAICIFLLLSALLIHKFWDQDTLLNQVKEFLHFLKNLFIVLLVWYLYKLLDL